MPITLPYTFTNGAVIHSAEVNANFAALNVGQTIQNINLTKQPFPAGAAAGTDSHTVSNMTLGAGDWDVRGVVNFWFTTLAGETWEAGMSSFVDKTPNAWGFDDLTYSEFRIMDIGLPGPHSFAVPSNIRRIIVTASTPIYLTAYAWGWTGSPAPANTFRDFQYQFDFVARRNGDVPSGFIDDFVPLDAQNADTVQRRQRMLANRKS